MSHTIDDIYEFASYPTAAEWDEICEPIKSKIDNMKFVFPSDYFNILDPQAKIVQYWSVEFNNKVFDLINTYVMVQHYFTKNIPDEEWYISPGVEGSSISYFPHFEDRHFIILYWFGYYTRHYYTTYFSLVDALYHIINETYKLGIKDELGYNRKVSQKIVQKNSKLFSCLKRFRKSQIYEEVDRYRNDLVHNFSPDRISAGIIRDNSRGVIYETGGDYTTSTTFIQNIDKSIGLISNLIGEFQANLFV